MHEKTNNICHGHLNRPCHGNKRTRIKQSPGVKKTNNTLIIFDTNPRRKDIVEHQPIDLQKTLNSFVETKLTHTREPTTRLMRTRQ